MKLCLLSLVATALGSIEVLAAPSGVVLTAVDYPRATWVPAASTNFSVANRPHDYPIDMIVIHDIEGTYASAITAFQDPKRLGSAHYVISYHGQVTQMVLEKDIAWHAGNWDYNTRSIGIEHEGYASKNLYTVPEYRTSAELAGSICSRWGVPMDRAHIIGHYQVPDPNHPGLFGGTDHHTDPGPYWNWTYYISLAQYYANLLPSPPHMALTATAYSGDGTATVQWLPARSCHNPIDTYDVIAQPGGIQLTVPGTATTASFTGLTNGVNYSFTVTAHNSDGQDSVTSNSVTPGPACSSAVLTASPASPQAAGGAVVFTATSSTCSNPQYQFTVQDSKGTWVVQQPFGSNTWTWDSYTFGAGAHRIGLWANHATADPTQAEASTTLTYTLSPFAMTDWHAAYDMSKAPTSWVAGRSQTFPVTVTNSGDVTWPSDGYGRVDLILHFAKVGGGSATRSQWLTIDGFSMPSNLAPGASVTFSATITAPSTTGSLVLEADMIKEHQFWFPQWQPVGVNVAAPDKTAGYDMSKVPTTWLSGQTQTFAVTVSNTSNYTWLSTGYYRTDLDLHFLPVAGGAAKRSTWLTNQAFSLPANLAPGGKATVNVRVTAPSKTGSMVLEALMVKEHQFWFQQWAPVNVTVAAAVWSASYNLTGAPASWKKGQTLSVTVTVTNTGNITWPSTGYYRVDLDVHFTSKPGGSANRTAWLTNQAFSMPADLAPGNSVTLTVSVTAPTSSGSMYMEAEMVMEHRFWFSQSASVPVTVA
jgi:N-acetyl-anhydromuramyl-L-alanine amidase AmpD